MLTLAYSYWSLDFSNDNVFPPEKKHPENLEAYTMSKNAGIEVNG